MGDIVRRHKATGAAALSETIDPGEAFQLEHVKIHLSAAGGAGDLTVTIDANAGAAYDVVLKTQDMTAVTDFVWSPERPISFENGDKMVVAWANANTRTYGLEVAWKGL
jgi:hypothetical protein